MICRRSRADCKGERHWVSPAAPMHTSRPNSWGSITRGPGPSWPSPELRFPNPPSPGKADCAPSAPWDRKPSPSPTAVDRQQTRAFPALASGCPSLWRYIAEPSRLGHSSVSRCRETWRPRGKPDAQQQISVMFETSILEVRIRDRCPPPNVSDELECCISCSGSAIRLSAVPSPNEPS